MTSPGGSGGAGDSQEIGRAHFTVDLQDNTAKALANQQKSVQDSNRNVQRQITSTAQIARNSVSLVTRSVGSNITNTVLEPIISIGESFIKAAEDAEVGGSRIEKSIKGAQIAGAGLLGAGVSLTLLGAKEKQAFDQLGNAIADLGLNVGDYTEQIDETVKQQEQFGHSAIQTQQALQLLTNATHDPTAAIEDMGEVADLAASRHLSLDQAARQVAITIGGGGRLLKQYNIDIIKNTDGTRDYAAMNAKLADVLHGQAAAAANNAGGEIKKLGVEIEDTVARFGEHWGPTITGVGTGLTALGVILEFVYNKKLVKATQAIAENTAAQAEEAAVSEETGATITESLEAQTAAVVELSAAYATMLEAATAAGVGASSVAAEGATGLAGAAVGTGAGAAAAGSTEAAAAATTTASEEIVAAENEVIASSGRLQEFFDEVMANMAAAANASGDEVEAALAEEAAADQAFAEAFAEAQASMEAAVASGTVSVVDGVATQTGALEEGAAAASASSAASGASVGLLARAIGPLSVALVAGAAAYGIWDMVAGKTPEIVGASVPPLNAYTEAIKENYGALNESVIAKADDAAASNGMLTDLNKLGITTEQFNAAVRKGPKALAALGDGITVNRVAASKMGQTFEALGKNFDSHEQQTDYLKKSYDNFADSIGKNTTLAENELKATSNLSAAQIAQARSMGISVQNYSSLIQSSGDAASKTQNEAEQNQVLIASNSSLQAVLGMTETQYNTLTQGMMNNIGIQKRMAAAMQGTSDIHSVFDPVLSAYDQWNQDVKSVTQAEQQQAATIRSGAHEVEQAKLKEAKAEEDIATVAKKGREDIAAADRDVAEAREKSAEDVVSANKKIVDSENALKDATQAVTDARQKANDAITQATRELRDMAENEQKARDELRSAQDDAAQTKHDNAQKALNANTNLTQQQLIDQQNALNASQDKINKDRAKIDADATSEAVIDAKHKLNDLLADDIEKRKQDNKLIQDGVDKNPDVVKAEKAQQDAVAAVTDAKNAQAKAEKDDAQAIKDAETKASQARVTAAQNNADAIQQQKDAEYDLATAEQSEQTANENATTATQNAKKAVDKSRTALNKLEDQTGTTDTALKNLEKTMKNMDKSLQIDFRAKGYENVQKATIKLQQSIEETLLEASGMSPKDAKAKAIFDHPDYNNIYNTKTGTYSKPAANNDSTTNRWDGGAVRGGSGAQTADDIPTLLSNNEHVWTAAEVQAAGGHDVVAKMRRAALEGQVQMLAGGGAVGPVIDATRMNITDRLKNSGYLSLLGKRFYGSDKYGKTFGGWPNEAGVEAFIRGVNPLPYVFGDVGPGAYDCSGLVGEVWARLTGHPSYHRYFTTDNEPNFFEPGPGRFTVGVTNHPGGEQHTAGRLNGLKFEARDSAEGIIIGPNAVAPESFEHVYHLKERNGFSSPGSAGAGIGNTGLSGELSPSAAKQAGRALMPKGWNFDDLDALWTQESSWRWNATGAPTNLGRAYGIPQSLPGNKMDSAGGDWRTNAATQIKWGLDYIKGRYGNASTAEAHERMFQWYDQGGYLQPGATMTMNKTGKPEAVLTNEQWEAILNGIGGGVHIDNFTMEVRAEDIREIQDVVEMIQELPQRVRAARAGTIQRAGRR